MNFSNFSNNSHDFKTGVILQTAVDANDLFRFSASVS